MMGAPSASMATAKTSMETTAVGTSTALGRVHITTVENLWPKKSAALVSILRSNP